MSATAAERDYTGALAGAGQILVGRALHVLRARAPCSVGIDIAGVNKYYNLTLAQHEIPETVREHYRLLPQPRLGVHRLRPLRTELPVRRRHHRPHAAGGGEIRILE